MLKAVISVQKEGKYYIATDLVTNVADQGLSEEEAINNLKKGLEEHYQILMEMAPKGSKTSFIEIEVERYAKASGPVSQ
jgi:predicted RNase H-like HicB family nuclease